uniref:Uncharacterized protein n=1 Tax=Trichogramma kaykai TaxID=54128 RepID=A0ABD2XSW2_9HYME
MRKHSFGISEKMYILRTREEAARANKEREEDEEKKRTNTKRVKWPLVTPSTRVYMMRFSIRFSSSSISTVAMADIIVAYHSTPHAASVYVCARLQLLPVVRERRDAANRRVCERGHRLRLTVYRSRRNLRNAHTLCSGTQHYTHHTYITHSHTHARAYNIQKAVGSNIGGSIRPAACIYYVYRTERQERWRTCWQFVRVHTHRLTHIHTRTFTYILWLRKSGKIAPNVKSTKSSTSLSSGTYHNNNFKIFNEPR